MYIVYLNNEIRYITNNFHDSLIVMLHFIKDMSSLNINTYIHEYYGENYVTFINKFTFENMSVLDMNKNKVYITNKFDLLLSEISKKLGLTLEENKKTSSISVKANLELLEEEKKIKLEKQNKLLNKNIDINLEEEDKVIHDTNEEDFKNKMQKYKTEIKKQEFLGNIKTYFRLKQDIQENKLLEENIADFFKEKFNILKNLDNNNLLDFKQNKVIENNNTEEKESGENKQNHDLIEKSFEIYLSKLTPEKENKKKYVPHNVHYLNKTDLSNQETTISELDNLLYQSLNNCKLDLSELK
jgi:hypothetical protein